MGHTYGHIKTASGKYFRFYKASSSTSEVEIQTDATNSPGAVPVEQSCGAAMNGETITHALFTEASGFLRLVYVMDKSGNTKAIFTNYAKTGAPNLGMVPMNQPVTIAVGDQIRGILKSDNNTTCAVLYFQGGPPQHYTGTGTSNPVAMTEYRSGSGLGQAGTGGGAITGIVSYSPDGINHFLAITDNTNVLRWSGASASTESFQVDGMKSAGMVPDLNWAISCHNA